MMRCALGESNNDAFQQARHGEGTHNVAENYYGTAAWDVRPPIFIIFEKALTEV